MDAISHIEHNFGAGIFTYHWYRDSGTTGRLEVTVYPNSQVEAGDGILVHSKKQSRKYIHDDYDKFLNGVAEATGLSRQKSE